MINLIKDVEISVILYKIFENANSIEYYLRYMTDLNNSDIHYTVILNSQIYENINMLISFITHDVESNLCKYCTILHLFLSKK